MRLLVQVLSALTLMLWSSLAIALDQQYVETIEYNGRLFATLRQTLERCNARKISKYSVESLRNVYDPGEELNTFDRAADSENEIWNNARFDDLKKLCAESLRLNGPAGAKWLAGP